MERVEAAPVPCLDGCGRPATHWHDGGPYALDCALAAIDEEGRLGFEPMLVSAADLASYYTSRGLDPALRTEIGR